MSTTSRVLPWRRNQSAVVEDLVPLLSAYKRRNPKGNVSLINAAYEMASAAHSHQSRMSGELYISHPIAVARIVDRGMGVGRKNGKVVAAPAARADCLVDHAVGVKARSSSVDVLVHWTRSAEIGSVGRVATTVQNQKVKITPVGGRLLGIRRGVETGYGAAIKPTEPAREVG